VDIKDVKRGRPALDPSLILSELAKTSSKWLDIKVLAQVESTNDLAILELSNASGDSVFSVTADEQLKGRGRLQREWRSPFGAGIALSVAIPVKFFRCEVSAIPLLVGIAASNCLMGLGANVRLKWPNDLMIEVSPSELKKIGGILVQRQGDHVVVGIGINTDLQLRELPTENATSLSLLGIEASREALIADLIFQLENTALLAPKEWLSLYIRLSSTIGTEVMVTKQADSVVMGIAINVLESGALLLESPGGPVEITSGDVVQVRPAKP
jgi:BirA family transcriptional regulator, biotin operon repressor / biotin---[acetyl-CoA-carboxylase] ligase